MERLFWQRGSASAGGSEVVAVTGLSRSSLYATFGGKQQLYVKALRRYVDQRSWPALPPCRRRGCDLDATADLLTLLAYGVNLRSRAGADASRLRAAVAAALAPLQP